MKEWLPAIKGHWRTFSTVINPHIKVACLKTIEFYKLSLTSIKPYAIRLQEQSIPFFQVHPFSYYVSVINV